MYAEKKRWRAGDFTFIFLVHLSAGTAMRCRGTGVATNQCIYDRISPEQPVFPPNSTSSNGHGEPFTEYLREVPSGRLLEKLTQSSAACGTTTTTLCGSPL